MKILVFDQFSDLGGAQQCLLDWLPAAVAGGARVTIAAPGDGLLRERSAEAGAAFVTLGLGRYTCGRKTIRDGLAFLEETPRLAAQIAGLVERHQPDLVFLNGPRVLPAAAHALAGGPPVLFHAHSYLRQRHLVWLAGRALRRVRATVAACCQWVAAPLARSVPPERLHIVYNGAAAPEAIVRGEGAPRIGVIGRISPEKGQALFLEAARRLAPDLPGARFVICGAPLFGNPEAERYHQSLWRMADGLPVDFLGWRADATAVLAGLDLLVVPSAEDEATTRVIPEAYAAGVPVVATRSGGIAEIVEDGVTAFLAPAASVGSLADAQRYVLGLSAESRQRVVAAARRRWEERFTLDRFREKMLGLLDRAAGRDR